jgi:hypothetical protein
MVNLIRAVRRQQGSCIGGEIAPDFADHFGNVTTRGRRRSWLAPPDRDKGLFPHTGQPTRPASWALAFSVASLLSGSSRMSVMALPQWLSFSE